MLKTLHFRPLIGFSSPHAQIIAAYLSRPGLPPPSQQMIIKLKDGDQLSCAISTPSNWQAADPTILMIHGLGGCESSSYMIRLNRRCYMEGMRVVRVNLRGCGSGVGLNQITYNAGNSSDILTVVERLKNQQALSPVIVIGFSLGGNIALKLAGELGASARGLIDHFIAVCPPLDLHNCVFRIEQRENVFYHRYYLKNLLEQSQKWVQGKSIHSIYEFDDLITAPLWGYRSALDYYEKCSCGSFLSQVRQNCHILFAADDPFIEYKLLEKYPVSSDVDVWLTQYGSHMGYIGWAGPEYRYFWLDRVLMHWIKGEFASDFK